MKRLIILAAVSLSACATVGSPETARQKLYAAYAAYNVAGEAAADYAETPTASPKAVATLNRLRKQAEPGLYYARAYAACRGDNATALASIDCAAFDFRPQTATGYALVINGAARAILLGVGR